MMKIAHLAERIQDYKVSIETVVEKKITWKTKTKYILRETLNEIVKMYDIGWRVQELNWIHSNEAVNITFDSFPPELIEKTNQIPAYQFIQGGALVFSQSYSGDVLVFILFPSTVNHPDQQDTIELGAYTPEQINEKMIVEAVDDFLKEMIKWDLPSLRDKVGFAS
ncbi:hypothetical protein ACFQ1M_16340 [Sungkyunkwania multivorans]|uniref:Uncharacterized protein n=1 Tax=Sungkyunkwania multivorans TaxID=1173618 RepID=A0ABW3D1T8_9FLAO